MGYSSIILRYMSGRRLKEWNQRSVNIGIDFNSYAHVKGRMFERWADNILAGARDNGYSEDGLIDNPVYIIESLLRDENFVERDLKVSTATDTTHVIVNGLLSSQDDYYNYAIYYNASATSLHKTYVTDYVGSTKSLTLAAADTNVADGDNIYLINIQGDNKIDYASFDLVGNTADGSRGTTATKWIFARSYTEKQNIRDLLTDLCFDAHCELIESVNPDSGINQFKLVALDPRSGDTWTNPAYVDGLEQTNSYLTPLENIFTQFRLRYFYDYGKGDFIKEIYVDKNGYPTAATILGDTEKNLCKYAEQSYQISRLFEFESMNIYDDATAERCLQKKIEWFTKQRLVVRYLTPIVGNADYIKYEVGDQVKLNFSKSIPTGLNNSSMFIITNKTIKPALSGGQIQWELLQID